MVGAWHWAKDKHKGKCGILEESSLLENVNENAFPVSVIHAQESIKSYFLWICPSCSKTCHSLSEVNRTLNPSLWEDAKYTTETQMGRVSLPSFLLVRRGKPRVCHSWSSYKLQILLILIWRDKAGKHSMCPSPGWNKDPPLISVSLPPWWFGDGRGKIFKQNVSLLLLLPSLT